MEMNKFWIFCDVIIFLSVFHVSNADVTYADETALRTKLRTGYDQAVRPSTPTCVDMFYSLRTLQSLDITKQTMTTTGWFSMYWNDPRLMWNASEYSNISAMDTNWIWRPEFFVSNSAEGINYAGLVNDEVRFRVYSNGDVRWMKPVPVTTACDVNIARFPFDSQTCTIEIVIWAWNGVDVFGNISNEINTAAYLENAEWRYDSFKVMTEPMQVCCPMATYYMMAFALSFTRLRPFYVINLIMPAMILSVCMILTFLLPTECGERLGYSMTILLSYTVLLTITADMMPTTSKETPYINLYLLILLIMCAVVVLNVVLSVKMFYLESKPPKWLQALGRKLEIVVFFQCCRRKEKVTPLDYDKVENITKSLDRKEKMTSQTDLRDDSDDQEEVTWQMLATIQDRLCLYIYSVAMVILITVFMLALYGYV